MSVQTVLAKNIIEIYKKHARAWTNLRGTIVYEKVWLDRFLAIIPANTQILDLGCGSGQTIAAYFIKQGYSVFGVDSSEVMLEIANENFPDQTWLRTDMRHLHLDKKFHAIIAWDSFFHLSPTDQRQMFQCFSDHAALGAALMFTSGPNQGEAISDMFGDALYHASLAPEEYRALFNRYGFELIKMIAEDFECTGHTVWLAKKSVIINNINIVQVPIKSFYIDTITFIINF